MAKRNILYIGVGKLCWIDAIRKIIRNINIMELKE